MLGRDKQNKVSIAIKIVVSIIIVSGVGQYLAGGWQGQVPVPAHVVLGNYSCLVNIGLGVEGGVIDMETLIF